MLKLQGITKTYQMGESQVEALRGIDLVFRRTEFAAILGPSGCGKTTLLNIIGGLDQYTSGDLSVAGRSTKQFKDKDWDAYRNHSIGFVFQSYNLIPHQTVLSNVELALTLSGVSRKERRRRAIEALEKVGLGDQLHKKPNQMSGGQMQRVAIARALVNDPEILLADEPTGALDSETSIQVMEILKEISKEKLVIMVTHNPDLAQQYATRIIRLLDGRVIADSDPVQQEEPEAEGKQGKTSMSFATALSLSLNNLMTKKGRTFLTAFAGSIGIIGIALILSLSSGVSSYIERVQRDTLSSYPLEIQQQTIDMSGVLSAMAATQEGTLIHPLDQVYSGTRMTRYMGSLMSEIQVNDLAALKDYLEDENTGIRSLVSDIQYSYTTPMYVYRLMEDGSYLQVNPSLTMEKSGLMSMMDTSLMSSNVMMTSSFSQMDAFQPLLDNEELIDSQFDILVGRMPETYDEVVLIVNSRNELSDFTLYTLGLRDQNELHGMMEKLMRGETIDSSELSFTYEEMLGLEFRLLVNTDFYEKQGDVWVDRSDDDVYLQTVLENAAQLRVVGILRPASDAVATSITGGIGYRSDLMVYLLNKVNESQIVQEQLETPQLDVFTGMPFGDVEFTIDDIRLYMDEYMQDLNAVQKAMVKALSDEQLMEMAKKYMAAGSNTTLQDNLTAMGVCSVDEPSSILIYPLNFEAKENIVQLLDEYNESVQEEQQIRYTDYVGLLMSSVTTIVDAISYVLIAFVAISLVVSSIMIGIITYISVLERTKEIGILRAIGASKHDISRVFNAETLIVGFSAGVIGIGMTLLLNIVINIILLKLTGIHNAAGLPAMAGVVLVGISMLLTLIAGIIPSRIAAKKDPVVALRSE